MSAINSRKVDSWPEKQPSLLIVDDNPMDVEGTFAIASQLGFSVEIAFDGREALNLAKLKMFDLIVLDWHMPVMTGRTFLRRFQAEATKGRAHRASVIIHSADEAGLQEGGDVSGVRVVGVWRKPMGALEMLRGFRRAREAAGL